MRIALVLLYCVVYPAVLYAMVFASMGKFAGGVITWVAQVIACVFAQPFFYGGRRFLWVCYDIGLEGNSNAILDAVCGHEEAGFDLVNEETSKAHSDKLKVPQVAVASRKEVDTLVALLEENGCNQSEGKLTYSCSGRDLQVEVSSMKSKLHFASIVNAMHRPWMVAMIKSGDHLRAAMLLFDDADNDKNGVLTWNNGEVRNYVHEVFAKFGLTPPEDSVLHQVFVMIDREGIAILDPLGALCLIDAMLRVLFSVHEGGEEDDSNSNYGEADIGVVGKLVSEAEPFGPRRATRIRLSAGYVEEAQLKQLDQAADNAHASFSSPPRRRPGEAVSSSEAVPRSPKASVRSAPLVSKRAVSPARGLTRRGVGNTSGSERDASARRPARA